MPSRSPGGEVPQPIQPSGELPLARRYASDAVAILDHDERKRFLDTSGRPRDPAALPWELLYRLEPELYAELVAGERLHEGLVAWLGRCTGKVLEIGAGSGRLTLTLAGIASSVTAVEPAKPLRDLLRRRLQCAGVDNVEIVEGFFDSLPSSGVYDAVVSCSSFAVAELDDPQRCLETMEQACRSGGLVAFVWPSDVPWLRARGYEHAVYLGPMVVEYQSEAQAARLARIFYPAAADDVSGRRCRFVDFTTLRINAPRDVCWKRLGATECASR